jgi:hypothetical protein
MRHVCVFEREFARELFFVALAPSPRVATIHFVAEPDFDALRAANEELERLVSDGALTRATFARVLADARRAVGEQTEFLEGILMRGVELGMLTLA